MKITSQDALLVIDVQNDFCPGGALAVPGGDSVIEPIHKIAPLYNHVLLTQDWHPAGHTSFASVIPAKSPSTRSTLPYGSQTLWPDHCVQSTPGAEFHPKLKLTRAELILRKGFRRDIDSYSAFFENDRTTSTGLAGYLRERGLTRVFLAGLAYDYCVGYSALDARRLGLPAFVIRDACRAIDLNGSVAAIEAEFAMPASGHQDSASFPLKRAHVESQQAATRSPATHMSRNFYILAATLALLRGALGGHVAGALELSARPAGQRLALAHRGAAAAACRPCLGAHRRHEPSF